MMRTLKIGLFAALAAACCMAFAGHPLTDFLSPEALQALSLVGGVPLAAGIFKNYVSNIQPVAAGANAVLTLGTGNNAPTLDKLQLTLSGGTFSTAKIDGIKGFINGKEFYVDGSAAVHNARRTYLGLTNDTAELVLDFTEPNARSGIEQNLSSLPLALMQDCRFEFALAASAVTPVIKALAHFRPPTNNPFIKKQRKLSASFAAGGEQTIYVPNGPNGGKLVRIWIHEGSAGNITAVELRARNATGIEATRSELQKSQVHNGLVPQAGVLVIDFIEDGNLAGWFDTSALADVELRLTGTAADAYTVYFEYLDPIGRL